MVSMMGSLVNINAHVMSNIAKIVSVVGNYSRITYEIAIFGSKFGYFIRIMNTMRQERGSHSVKFSNKVLWVLHGDVETIIKCMEETMYRFMPEVKRNARQRATKKKCSPRRGRILKTAMRAGLKPATVTATRFVFPTQLDNSPSRLEIDVASRCILRNRGDFVWQLKDKSITIQGYAGIIQRRVLSGTLRYRWIDDIGWRNMSSMCQGPYMTQKVIIY